jgi:two-component system, cell cycle response regulator DivK
MSARSAPLATKGHISDVHAFTILIVDDDSDVRRMYGSYFSYVGAGTLSARNGAEALELIHSRHPDAMLLDLSMPRMTGWELLKVLRADPATASLPVVAITGHVAPAVEREVLDAGADRFLSKPCLPHIVFNTILQLVRDGRAD